MNRFQRSKTIVRLRDHALALPALALLLLVAGCAGTSGGGGNPDRFGAPDDGALVDGRVVPSSKTLYSMSRVLASQQRDAECEAVLTRLIEEHPAFMPAYQDLAELYLRHDRVESAVEVLKAGRTASPQDAVILNNLGICYLLQARSEPALECFTAAAAGVPRDIRSRANMAVALGMLGRMDEALSIYEQILPLADAHHNLAVLYDARGMGEMAETHRAIAEEHRLGRRRTPPVK